MENHTKPSTLPTMAAIETQLATANATKTTLNEIRRSADVLGIFATQAATTTDSVHAQTMLKACDQVLKELQELHTTLMQTPRQSAGHSYTSLSGREITVESLDWLEDGYYWEFDEDFDEDGFESGDNYPCSRYAIGTDENGDGISVWLNDDMQEVEA